jgi:hypothetical protein
MCIRSGGTAGGAAVVQQFLTESGHDIRGTRKWLVYKRSPFRRPASRRPALALPDETSWAGRKLLKARCRIIDSNHRCGAELRCLLGRRHDSDAITKGEFERVLR